MKHGFYCLFSAISVLTSSQSSNACTDFKFAAQDGSILITRTQEYSVDLKSNLRTSQRDRSFQTVAPNGKTGMTWKAKYGYLFLDGMNVDSVIDGMNEVGLSFEALYLPGETQYQTVPEGREGQALPYMSIGDYILGNFKTVNEVRHGLENIYVFQQSITGLGDVSFPLHYSIYDSTGKGIVVEIVKGKMTIYDNEVGVLTNSPTYDWQVTNLRNYVQLSPYTPKPIIMGSATINSTGHGAGMKGLPGDISPPSRFVKIAYLKTIVNSAKNISESINTAQHIINNVDIPAGYVRDEVSGQVANEITQWTVFKDLTNKTFYYKTYGNTTLRSVSLSQLDFSEKAHRLRMPIENNQFTIDMTKKFQQNKSP